MTVLDDFFTEILKPGLQHGAAGNWDEILIYGGIALVFIFIVVFAIFKGQQAKPDVEDEEPPEE